MLTESSINTKDDIIQFVNNTAADGVGMDLMFAEIDGVSQADIDNFENKNSANTLTVSDLIEIPAWFTESLKIRTKNNSVVTITKPTSTSDSNFNPYKLMDVKYVAYLTAMKPILSAINNIDTSNMSQRVKNVLNL